MTPEVFPLIFTDLDGSLLDHYTYSWAPAKAVLSRLKKRSIPVIPTTSKTAAELLELRAAIDLDSPFIVENGAAVCLPREQGELWKDVASREVVEKNDYLIHSLARPRAHWLQMLDEIREDYPGSFEGFATMSLERIIELTSLEREGATKALDREYGEPVHWSGNEGEKASFISCLSGKGARVLEGGRFLHIGDHVDKGMALGWLADCFKRRYPHRQVVTVALGDGNNDVDMLERADYAVIIRSPVHDPPAVKRQDTIVTEQLGPAGWAEAVQGLLDRGFTG